jgi:phosphinothricin acetyltransferase
MRIEPMTSTHADAVLAIYQAGIDEGNATFETTAPTWDEFDSKRMPEHRFVAVDIQDAVMGWVAAVPVSDRRVYAGVVEHSVYVSPDTRGLGVGRALLEAIIDDRGEHVLRRYPLRHQRRDPAQRRLLLSQLDLD